MFCVLDRELEINIKNGTIKNGFMVKVIGDKEENQIFFDTELKANEYIKECLEEDNSKRFLFQTVNLHVK